MNSGADPIPLIVDLDGTLTPRDTLVMMVMGVSTHRPWLLPRIMWLARHSRARAKVALWNARAICPETIRFSPSLVDHLRRAHAADTPVFLVTGAPQQLADAVASHLPIFVRAVGSSSECNLTGERKAAWLVQEFGERGFDYAGNSRADLHVWRRSRKGIVCNATSGLIAAASAVTTVSLVLDDRRYRGPALSSMLAYFSD